MKQSIICVAALLLFAGCKKSQFFVTRPEILGKWEYITTSGYPFTQPVSPPGNGNIIVIGENNLFERRKHDTLVFSGYYRLEEKKDCYERDKKILFKTSDELSADDYFISVKNGQLYISSSTCLQDGGSAIWRKL